MSSELKKKTVKGVTWSAIDNLLTIGVNFVVGVVLARLLTPEDYGMIAMIAIAFAIANTFVQSGFGTALVRKQIVTEEDNSTAFYFNILVSLFCYGIIYITSPFIASFYNRPLLSMLIRVEGLCVVIGAVNIVQRTVFTRNVDFKSLTYVNIGACVISGIVGIEAAYQGWGVWSLVFSHITKNIVEMIVLWVLSPWRPKVIWSGKSFKYLWGFGSKLLASNLITTLYGNVYPIVIGKFYSPASLGAVTRASEFASLPSSNITNVLQRVTFPVLSQIQDDTQRLAINYRRILRVSVFVIFPLMVGLAALAKPVVYLLITEKWSECVLYLQLICFSSMWYPLHAINLNLLQVKGRSDLFLNIEIIKRCVQTIVMICCIPLGVTAICASGIFSALLYVFINTYYTGKIINVGFFRQMKDITPTFALSLVMGIIVFGVTFFINNNIIQLIAGITLGAMVYLGGSYLLRFIELKELVDIIKRR